MNRDLQNCKAREGMVTEEVLGIREAEGARRIVISPKRVITWALIFTNIFFLSYFFGMLFGWV